MIHELYFIHKISLPSLFFLTLLKHIPFGKPKHANSNFNPAPNTHDKHHFPFSACSLKSVITEV